MILTAKEIANMIDLSCVRTISNRADIDEMVAAACSYGFGQVSVLQSFIPTSVAMLKGSPDVHIVGNVSFPTGSDSTAIKTAQAKELLAAGCHEIDMVMNIGKLRSGELDEVEADVRAVIEIVQPIPVKVIIEIMYLTRVETQQACEICVRSGASFVKTGTGWAEKETTLDDVALVKSIVGDRIKIKASGGIRDLDTLLGMYRLGARRFGVNLRSGKLILDDCSARGGSISF